MIPEPTLVLAVLCTVGYAVLWVIPGTRGDARALGRIAVLAVVIAALCLTAFLWAPIIILTSVPKD